MTMADMEYRNDGLHVNSAFELQGVRQETIDNPEFIQVTTDIEGRIIEATKKDGKKVFYGGIEEIEDLEKDIDALDERVSDLEKSNETIVIVVDKDGNGDFTSLLEANLYALQISPYSHPYSKEFKKVNIIVHTGVYDLKEEYKAHFGNNYFDDYQAYYNGYAHGYVDTGIFLGPNMHLKGVGFVLIKFQYGGDGEDDENNDNVHKYFSPLNTSFNISVDNIHFTTGSSRVGPRYIIHDDFAYYGGNNIFSNLTFEGRTDHLTTIGSGMFSNNTYILRNLYFAPSANIVDISYHNRNSSDPQEHVENFLWIDNCKGYAQCVVQTIGLSIDITKCIVSNSEFKRIEKVMHGQGGEDNMELIKFNNIETLYKRGPYAYAKQYTNQLTSADVGYEFFATDKGTIGKPIYFDGNGGWVYSDGSIVTDNN